jgi:hypothetical protein
MSEPRIRITHLGIDGDEFQWVTQEAFDVMWEGLGWSLAGPEDEDDVVYSIPSTEKGVPFGVATLDAAGNVVQPGLGGGGGVTVGTMNAAIAAAIALVTPASIGAHPDTSPIVLLVDNVQSTPMRSTHPIANGLRQDYALGDGTCWVMAPLGQKVQISPGFVSPSVELALEKTVNSLTLSTVFTLNLEPNAVYDLDLPFAYESTVAASGERLRVTFDPPPGTTGWYGVQSMNSAGQAVGTLASNFTAKKWTETFDIGGSGAALPRYAKIIGTIYTGDHEPAPDAEAAFDFRARLSTLDGAGVPLVPAKIYGANTVDYDAARMTCNRLT